MGAPLLEIESLDVRYGQAQALFGVSLTVNAGEAVGIVGRNGAGKTTLLSAIAGLKRSGLSGSIRFEGADITSEPADVVARRGVALVRENGKVFSALTVAENLVLGRRLASLRKVDAPTFEEIVRWFPLLEGRSAVKAGYLSGGQRQSLALAVAVASSPDLLLLDEPATGLAAATASRFFEHLAGWLGERGTTALIVEQNPAWLRGLTHRVETLEVGSLTASTAATRTGQDTTPPIAAAKGDNA